MRNAKLGDFADVVPGVSYNPADISTQGIRILRGGNLQNGQIQQKQDDVYLDRKYKSVENQVLGGDTIVVASTGSTDALGKAATSWEDIEETQIGAFLRIVRPKAREYAALVSAWLTQPIFSRYIVNQAKGTGINNIRREHILDYPINIPNGAEGLEEFSTLYEAIESKIALNRKKIEKLEALAKTIYDYWFVQFDFPDANGRPYKSSGGKMVYNPILKREIPEGWHAGTLDIVLKNLKDGTHNPPKRTDKGVALLTGEMFGDMYLDYGKATYISNEDYNAIHSTYRPEEWDIILTKIGTLGKVNYLTRDDLPIAIHCNSALLQFKDEYVGPYSLMLCRSDDFCARLKRKKGQSVQEFVSLGSLASIELEVPRGIVVREFNLLMSPVFSSLEELRRGNRHLTSLRDFLLPLLMNGQVEVGE